jgi:hypothetical protein
MCPSLLCHSRLFSMFNDYSTLQISTFAILSTWSIKTSSLQHMSFPYYGVNLHVSYDANGFDELYSISLIGNASYKKQVPFDVRYVENTINPFYFTIWKFYEHTSFSYNNVSFTSYYCHRCYNNIFKS